MNEYIKFIFIVTITLCLAACGSEHKEKAVAEDHVWQSQVDSLEKAKAVEATIMESAARQRQAMDGALNNH